MSECPAKFCRDARAVATAWGARVYVHRGQRSRQLAPVLEAMRRPDFPKKSKHGYRRAEVLTWGETNVAAEDRTIIISDPSANGQSTHAGEELFKQFEDPVLRKRLRLASLAQAYFTRKGRKLNEQELAELRESGWIPRDEQSLVNGEYPKRVTGQPQIASLVVHRFKIQCNRQIVQRWRKQAPVPFPPPNDRGEYDVKECFDWTEKYIVSKLAGTGDTGDLFAVAASEELRGKIEREQHERWQREKEKGGWIEQGRHEATLATAGVSLRTSTRDAFEIQLPKILNSELSGLIKDSGLIKKMGEAVRQICRRQFDAWQIEVGRRLDELAPDTETVQNQ